MCCASRLVSKHCICLPSKRDSYFAVKLTRLAQRTDDTALTTHLNLLLVLHSYVDALVLCVAIVLQKEARALLACSRIHRPKKSRGGKVTAFLHARSCYD